MAQKRRAAPKFASAAFTDVATPETWGNIQQQPKAAEDDVLPAKGPARSPAEFLEVESDMPNKALTSLVCARFCFPIFPHKLLRNRA